MLYDVITSFDKISLVEKVNSCLIRGWKLQGGISVSISQAMGQDSMYAQAITFEEESVLHPQQPFVEPEGVMYYVSNYKGADNEIH